MAEGRRIRVPEEDYDFVVAFISFLSNWRLSHSGTQEEREKEKEPKRNKEKEEKNSLSTREALLNSILENNQKENLSEMPTEEEVQKYLDQLGEKRFNATRFISYYNGFEHPSITDWKSVVNGWRERERKKINFEITEGNEQKQKSKNAKTPSIANDGNRENGEPQEVASQEPNLPRRELVEKILREKYPVDEAQAEQMASVVENAMADADGREGSGDRDCEAADRIDTLAADKGVGPVVYWIGRSILARAESLGTGVGVYDGRRIVADAESILKLAKGAYRGRLTARIFLGVLNSMKEISSGKLGMEIMLKMKTIK